MSIQPGRHNINLQRRADYTMALQFKDSAGSFVDLTGWTVYAQAWDKTRSTKYADWVVSYTDRLTGQVQLSLTDTQTTAFPDELEYDVLLESPSLIRTYWLEGTIYVSEGYTA